MKLSVIPPRPFTVQAPRFFPPTRKHEEPLPHLVTVVLIFCSLVFAAAASSLLVSHSFTCSKVSELLLFFFPIQHSRGHGKGVSALVLPWG